jgi:hypothetical protein
MGEGSGKPEGGGTDLTQKAVNSEDTTEGLVTDSGSGILLGSSLYRGGRKIERELSGDFNYWWPCERFNSDNRFQNGNRYLISDRWKGNSIYILFSRSWYL